MESSFFLEELKSLFHCPNQSEASSIPCLGSRCRPVNTEGLEEYVRKTTLWGDHRHDLKVMFANEE
jgi:hypothetical protein